MTVNAPLLALIAKRFRDPSKPRLTQSEMAERMGYGKTWASKLLSGQIRNISDEQVAKLEEFLGIRLTSHPQELGTEAIPELAAQLGRRMKGNEPLSQVVAALLELTEGGEPKGPKWFSTHDMTGLGYKIIGIVNENSEKPGKVARLVLELVA